MPLATYHVDILLLLLIIVDDVSFWGKCSLTSGRIDDNYNTANSQILMSPAPELWESSIPQRPAVRGPVFPDSRFCIPTSGSSQVS